MRPVLLRHHPHRAQEFSAASRSLIAVRRQDLQAAISNAPQVWVVALQASSPVDRVRSTPRAPDLQDLAAPVHPGDVPDSAHVPGLALRVRAALAVRGLLVALRRPVRRRVRSVHHRIAHAAVDNSIPRPRKAQ